MMRQDCNTRKTHILIPVLLEGILVVVFASTINVGKMLAELAMPLADLTVLLAVLIKDESTKKI